MRNVTMSKMPKLRKVGTPLAIEQQTQGRDIIHGGFEGGIVKYRADRAGAESWALPGCKSTQSRVEAERVAEAIHNNQLLADLSGYRKVVAL